MHHEAEAISEVYWLRAEARHNGNVAAGPCAWRNQGVENNQRKPLALGDKLADASIAELHHERGQTTAQTTAKCVRRRWCRLSGVGGVGLRRYQPSLDIFRIGCKLLQQTIK
ncbi:unnamed protein product [Pieris brassicae]|uniref:Uncharacterized protein n=1 Tax=Pieris brassicae TaxID=7116 RepID=A0A9P0XGY7_PIEBR|nr:unnamed protein product [Pieris brassicae]